MHAGLCIYRCVFLYLKVSGKEKEKKARAGTAMIPGRRLKHAPGDTVCTLHMDLKLSCLDIREENNFVSL